VWEIPTQSFAGAHFATFPEELARRCILAGSKPGDVVLDPFGGSGTVAQVATGNGRESIYIDLNPKYLELAKQRIGPMLCEGVA
jgi:DNA modification methylase